MALDLEPSTFKRMAISLDHMTSKTITVNVPEDVEKRFRRVAVSRHGKCKGYLGRAVMEAMENWVEEAETVDAVASTMKLLDEGVDLGGLKYRLREELHAR